MDILLKIKETQSKMEKQKVKALIIVPPFAILEYPSISSHTLQAYAKFNGFKIDILYSNIIF